MKRIILIFTLVLIYLIINNGVVEAHDDIFKAVEEGNLQKVKAILGKKPGLLNANEKWSKSTPLCIAAGNGHLVLVKYLISKGAVINTSYPARTTPLYQASREGHLEIVRYLIKKGAWVNEKEGSPLHAAAEGGHADIAKCLLDNNAFVDSTDNNNETPLFIVIQSSCNKKIIELLLQSGAKVNLKNPEGKTPLHFMVTRNNPCCVKLLLKYKAELNVQDNYGMTPLHEAVFYNQSRSVKILLENGADANIRNKEGKTPLGLALGMFERDKKYLPPSLIKRSNIVNMLQGQYVDEDDAIINIGEDYSSGDNFSNEKYVRPILFVKYENISMINADGTGRRDITTDDGYSHPRWSPDGKYIACYTHKDNKPKIIIFNKDLKLIKRIDCKSARGSARRYEWNREGNGFIYYRYSEKYDACERVFIDLATGEHKVLESKNMKNKNLALYREKKISPDGKMMIISSIAYFPNQLILIDSKGKKNIIASSNNCYGAVWSKDGKKIAYLDQGNVYVYDVSSGKSKKITPYKKLKYAEGLPQCVRASWSTDGEKIVYEIIVENSGRGGCIVENPSVLFVIDSNGNNNRKLIWGEDPDW